MNQLSKCILFTLYALYFSTNLHSAISNEEYTRLENRSTQAVKKFVKSYRNGAFTLIADGKFADTCTEDIFSIWVTANSKETLQSGQALAKALLKDYFSELQSNKDVTEWYKCLLEWQPRLYKGDLSLKNVRLRIAFWDENVERPKAPYLSEIDFAYGKLYYYEADPETQALKLILEEPYNPQ